SSLTPLLGCSIILIAACVASESYNNLMICHRRRVGTKVSLVNQMSGLFIGVMIVAWIMTHFDPGSAADYPLSRALKLWSSQIRDGSSDIGFIGKVIAGFGAGAGYALLSWFLQVNHKVDLPASVLVGMVLILSTNVFIGMAVGRLLMLAVEWRSKSKNKR